MRQGLLFGIIVFLGEAAKGTLVNGDLPFPFGADVGDALTDHNDDESSIQFNLGRMLFLGKAKTSFYQNTNGVVTFDSPLKDFRWNGAFPSNDLPDLVAAYWTDIDIRPGGSQKNQLFARDKTAEGDTQTSQDIIRNCDSSNAVDSKFTPSSVAVITYNRVNSFDFNETVENTFQVAFAFNDTDTWVIWAYDKLEFFAAESSANQAMIGVNGDVKSPDDSLFNISSNDEMLALLENSFCGIPGVYAYRVSTKGPIRLTFVERVFEIFFRPITNVISGIISILMCSL